MSITLQARQHLLNGHHYSSADKNPPVCPVLPPAAAHRFQGVCECVAGGVRGSQQYMKAASTAGELSTVTTTLEFKEIQNQMDRSAKAKVIPNEEGEMERGVAHPERHLAVFRQ